MSLFEDSAILGKYTPRPAQTMETHTQRSAVAALIGRCEGLISNRQIPEFQAVRLLELLNDTCVAFDMRLPQLENDERECAL